MVCVSDFHSLQTVSAECPALASGVQLWKWVTRLALRPLGKFYNVIGRGEITIFIRTSSIHRMSCILWKIYKTFSVNGWGSRWLITQRRAVFQPEVWVSVPCVHSLQYCTRGECLQNTTPYTLGIHFNSVNLFLLCTSKYCFRPRFNFKGQAIYCPCSSLAIDQQNDHFVDYKLCLPTKHPRCILSHWLCICQM